MRAAVVAALLLAAPAAAVVLRAPQVNVTDMETAYAVARNHTQPPIVPNVSDTVWYMQHYMTDANNSLEALTLSVPDTLPSPAQQAAEQAKDDAAMARIKPQVMAEEAEAEDYYHNVFPVDSGNDLEDFTYTRNYTLANANLTA
mmetsp:Transcript_71764/g.222730  ORF Transcript_71764/g.222730 Transcript_71764/m.222730 type:complete len:144 (+) Transcript_71764:81-512(+)